MDKKIVTQIWAAALSLGAVFGGMGCLVSGFALEPIGFGTVISWILAAVVFSICFSRRMGLYPMAGLVLLGIFLWLRGYLSGSLELLLEEVSSRYDSAYGWGIIGWSVEGAENARTGTGLCWLGLPIVIGTCFAVQRRSGVSLAVLLSVLPLGCCMIVTDTVPGLVPLFLLLLTVLLLLMTQTVRRRDEAQGNRLLAILTLPVAVGLGLLLLLIPQAGYDRQGGAQKLEDMVVQWLHRDLPIPDLPQPTRTDTPEPSTAPVGSGSAPKQENLLTVGPKVQSDMRVMTVRPDSEGMIYLRGAGYDRYSGTAWSIDASSDGWWPQEEAWEETGTVRISTAVTHDVLYLPYYAAGAAYDTISGGKADNTHRLREYSLHVGRIMAEQLSTEGYGADMDLYLELPEQTRLWAEKVIEEIFGTSQPPLTAATAYAIADYVRASASYDLKTPRMDSDYTDFAQWFLSESDRGYCVHFATATAVLLRAAGIPSRYVTGYTVYAGAGQSVTVTGKHAHAWAEFRLPGCSWYLLESTPDYEEETPGWTWPELPEASAPYQTEEIAETTPDILETNTPKKEPSEALKGMWGWVAAALLCMAVIIQWRIRVTLRRRRGSRGRSRQRALERWQHHALMAKLLNQSVDKELLEIAQRARFSQHATTAQELEAFCDILDSQIRELKKRPFHLQLYYTLILALY